jgi:DNA replication protein
LKNAGYDFLSINLLTSKMSISFLECSNLVLKLIQSNYITFDIDIDDQGKSKEKYTLEPLYDKIFQHMIGESDQVKEKDDQNEVVELIHLIEAEFGRTLSSFEIELITSWINTYQFNFDLIKLAIKEALMANAYNLKYVDRILINWKKKNIKTADDAAGYTKTYKRFEAKAATTPIEETEKYVSWMK